MQFVTISTHSIGFTWGVTNVPIAQPTAFRFPMPIQSFEHIRKLNLALSKKSEVDEREIRTKLFY